MDDDISQRASDPLELEQQVVGSHPIRVLGAELRISEKRVHVFNHYTVPVAPIIRDF